MFSIYNNVYRLWPRVLFKVLLEHIYSLSRLLLYIASCIVSGRSGNKSNKLVKYRLTDVLLTDDMVYRGLSVK